MRKNLKKAVFFLLFHTCAIDGRLKILKQKYKYHPCIILLYHRIINDETRFLDKGPVVHHYIKRFREEVAYLKRNFHILSMDELCDIVHAGSPLKKPSLIITFDDGYLDNYTLAYPVLRELGVPAIIYLTTGLIGTNGRTWPDQIEHALLKTMKESFDFPEIFHDGKVHIGTENEKAKINTRIAQALKQIPDSKRKELLRKLFRTLDVSEIQENDDARMMLNWDEITEMAKNGITCGSHSHTHPILSKMPLAEAKDDILKSKKILEEKLKSPIRHFAFPNGRPEDFSEELKAYCRAIGFETIASVTYGVNSASADNLMSLKRIGANSPYWMMAGEIYRELRRWYLHHEN
jgi:peptidoglycan/xylan/chitin deacetylase (PgdA/CDA1 family)